MAGLGTITELEEFVEKHGLRKLQEYLIMRLEDLDDRRVAREGSQRVS
jgi:hypothetical protein